MQETDNVPHKNGGNGKQADGFKRHFKLEFRRLVTHEIRQMKDRELLE